MDELCEFLDRRMLIDLLLVHTIHNCSTRRISAVRNWNSLPGARKGVPEVEVEDFKTARLGYGQSKLVAERILVDTARLSRVTTSLCRVGGVAGPIWHGEHGEWRRQEWVLSLIASSKILWLLPRHLGPLDEVDWIPVDYLVSIMVELLDTMTTQC